MSGTELLNKGNHWQSNEKWKFKTKGSLLYIENISSKKILTVGDDNNVNEKPLIKNGTRQMWTKGVVNSEGYFTLQNSQKVMTASSDKKIKIKGIFLECLTFDCYLHCTVKIFTLFIHKSLFF